MKPEDLSTQEPEAKTGLLGRLRRGLAKTQAQVWGRVQSSMSGRAQIEEEVLDELEDGLLAADLGVEATLEMVDGLRDLVRAGQGGDLVHLREMLVDQVAISLLDAPTFRWDPAPRVTLIVGVNGAGKTTTIAKLARQSLDRGEKVLLAAADTFRAAAVEQLAIWGERLGVDVIRQKTGADPAAVVFDAVQASKARAVDHLIIDTAGRLHTKGQLMQELGKIGRVIDREAGDWHRRTVLILDATGGQNALSQAREFGRVTPVDALIVTKVDGSAKGGVVVAIARELRLPVAYIGVGEGAEDLVEFHARDFARALLG